MKDKLKKYLIKWALVLIKIMVYAIPFQYFMNYSEGLELLYFTYWGAVGFLICVVIVGEFLKEA